MYKELIKINDLRKQLEVIIQKERTIFEDSIALQKAQLDDLTEKENRLKEEVILEMELTNMISHIDEKSGKNIIYQTRQTKQIENPDKIIESLKNYQSELKDIGIDSTEIIVDNFLMETVISNKKIVLDVADKLEKVENIILDGIAVKETKFLTIKNI